MKPHPRRINEKFRRPLKRMKNGICVGNRGCRHGHLISKKDDEFLRLLQKKPAEREKK